MEIVKAVLVVLVAASFTHGQLPVTGCRKVLDAVLVIDGSDSISDVEFEKMKLSITALINKLDIGIDQIWLGLVLYSSDITEVIELQNNATSLLPRISQLKHARQGTNTALAIQSMNAILNSGRQGVPKMGVVITDGLSLSPATTHAAAVEAIGSGVSMFSVGIGHQVHFGELGGLATGPGYVLNFTDFDDLSLDFIDNVASEICPEPECRGMLDLIVVVDGSDSIGDDDFLTLKSAILRLFDGLILGENNVKFGLVLYSTNVTTILNLGSDEKELRTQVAALTHPRQGTNTHIGIKHMNLMFAKQGRKGVPKAGIVITDGNSKHPKKTAAEAAVAKRNKVNMYAVGVTKHIAMKELKNIASSDDKVVPLKTFDQLKAGIMSVMKQVCPVKTTTTIKPTTPVPITTPKPKVDCVTSDKITLIPNGLIDDDDRVETDTEREVDDDDRISRRPNQAVESADEDDDMVPRTPSQAFESSDEEDNMMSRKPFQSVESADDDHSQVHVNHKNVEQRGLWQSLFGGYRRVHHDDDHYRSRYIHRRPARRYFTFDDK